MPKLIDTVLQLEPLTKAVKTQRCVLFVGSGLSVGAGYKSWGALIQSLVDAAKQLPHARTKGIEQFEEAKDFFTLAEFARAALGPNNYSTILRTELGRRATPTQAHIALASTRYRGVITTNYDRLLETVFTQVRGWAPSEFTPESVSALASALYNPEPFIFKLHGNISSPESIVLTSRDYDRLILHNPHVRSFLQAVFLNYTVLFVGYSLRDPDFELVLRELTLIFQGYTPTHYAFLPDAPDFAIEHLLQRMNIQALPYEPHNSHAEVTEALKALQDVAPFDSNGT
jgi:hypothetical protein